MGNKTAAEQVADFSDAMDELGRAIKTAFWRDIRNPRVVAAFAVLWASLVVAAYLLVA